MRTILFAALLATGFTFSAPSLPAVDPDNAVLAAGGKDGGKKKKDEEKEEDARLTSAPVIKPGGANERSPVGTAAISS